MPTPFQSRAEGEPRADAEPDDPIADEREQQRPARVVEAAKHSRADDLRAVDELECGSDAEEADGEADDDRVRRHVVEEQGDEPVRGRPT